MRNRPCRPRRAGDGGAGVVAGIPETQGEIRCERVLATEQMAGTGDVKPHRAGPIGRLGHEAPVDGDPWAVASAPAREPGKRDRIARRIGRHGFECREHGACIGKRHAGRQPGGGRRVDCSDNTSAMRLRH